MDYQLILCTCPDRATAEQIAAKLIGDRLAACVNILPAVNSVYLWQGEVETAEEHLLIIKTRKDQYPQIEQQITALHPYELPEIIAVSIAQGLPDYLKWIDACLVTP